jgi:RimJ/RimL family protein N-acetyltransferase
MKTTKTIREIQHLESERLTFDLLLDENEKDQLLELQRIDFETGYIKTLYGERPDGMTFQNQCGYHMSCKFDRNNRIDLDGKHFNRMYFVVKCQNEIIGSLEVYGSTKSVEFGLFITQKSSGEGYGKEALKRGVDLIREVIPEHGEMKWECYADNIASCKVAESCGFEKQGTDQYMYDLNDKPRYGRMYKFKNTKK